MSNRKEKITLLKQQVNKMQNQLKILQKCENQPSSKWNIITNIRELSINTKGKDGYSNNQKNQKNSKNTSKQNNSPSPKRSFKGSFTTREYQKQHIEHNLSKALKNIINKINDDFYIQNKKTERDYQEGSINKDKSIFNQTTYVGQRYKYNSFGQRRVQTSRSPKLRTYACKPTDIILNPEKQQLKGIKIVKKIQRSPKNMLTENPKSNPNLYLFNSTQPVYIQKRTHLQDKNKSSIVLSPSTLHMIPSKTANSQEKQCQSQKKHFQRHIQENICSKYKTLC